MHIAQLNYVYDPAYSDPDALLEHFAPLQSWSEALLAAGATRVTVGQRFWRDLRLRRNGVEYIFRNDDGSAYPRALTWPRELHGDIAALRPDVAHVNGMLFPIQTWALRRVLLQHAALVVQDHAGVLDLRSWRGVRYGGPPVVLRWAISKIGLGCADGFLFAAEDQAKPWRAARLIKRDQPVHEVMEASRALQPVPRVEARDISGLRGEPALLWVGQLNENEDPLTVLTGFELALPDMPGAHLTMVYTGNELLSQIQAHLNASPALAEHVSLLDNAPNEAMAAFYSAADIFVLGSHHEDNSYKLIEALACGAVPVVPNFPLFRVITGGIAMRTARTEGPQLWTPKDAQSLASALVALERRSLLPLRDAAREHFENNLSWSAIGKQAMSIYAELLQQRMSDRPRATIDRQPRATGDGRPSIRDSS